MLMHILRAVFVCPLCIQPLPSAQAGMLHTENMLRQEESKATRRQLYYSVQVALVAGSTYIFVEVCASCLFLATRDAFDNGYYPSSGMVTPSLASF